MTRQETFGNGPIRSSERKACRGSRFAADVTTITPLWYVPIVDRPGRDSINDTYSGTHGLRLATVFLPDDLDGNGRVEAADIDLLSEKVTSRSLNTAYDLNANGVVDEDDRRVWVEDVVGTYFGDVNLDGRFGSGDLVQVLEAGHYEDDNLLNSSWSTGDWDGNREFESRDFVFVLQRGGYEAGVRAAVAVVPEPSGVASLAVGLAILAWWRRKTF